MVPKFCVPGLLKVMVCGDAGITLLDAADASPVPAALLAVMVKVYATPLVKPVTVTGEPAPVAVTPPGLAVTVYTVMALPPVKDGDANVTVAWVLPAVAVPMVGAPGTTALTVKVCVTVVAAFHAGLPA
ncbi:hypothetical protein D3C71_883390 [compost metagenome]